MFKILMLFTVVSLTLAVGTQVYGSSETDVIKTSQGDLKITFIGHGTLMFDFGAPSVCGATAHGNVWGSR